MEPHCTTSRFFLILWLLLAGISMGNALSEDSLADEPKPSQVDADIAIAGINGEVTFPLRCKPDGGKAAVVIFITNDCPIANRFAPEIERIRSDYAGKGVALTLAHVDPDLDAETAKTHAKEYGLKASVVIDREHVLVRATGATVTPEAIVIDPKGAIQYRGRINDLFAGYGDRRKEPRNHDLRDALDAVLAGKPVAVPETRALGCFIQE